VCVVWIRRGAVDPPRALVASTHHTHTHTHTPQTLHHPQLKRWPRPRPPSLCQSRATPAVWSSSNQIFKPARRGSTWHGPSTDTRPRRSLPPHHTHTRAAGLAQASLTPRLWCASNTLKRGRTQTFIAPTVPSSSDRRAADPHKRCKQTFAIHPRWPLLPPPPSSDTHTHCPTRSKCRGPLFVGSHGPFVGPFNCFVAASRARGACCGGALPPGHADASRVGAPPGGDEGDYDCPPQNTGRLARTLLSLSGIALGPGASELTPGITLPRLQASLGGLVRVAAGARSTCARALTTVHTPRCDKADSYARPFQVIHVGALRLLLPPPPHPSVELGI